MNFEGVYLRDGWVDLSQIWNGRCPTLREYSQGKWFVFVQAFIKLQMCEYLQQF